MDTSDYQTMVSLELVLAILNIAWTCLLALCLFLVKKLFSDLKTLDRKIDDGVKSQAVVDLRQDGAMRELVHSLQKDFVPRTEFILVEKSYSERYTAIQKDISDIKSMIEKLFDKYNGLVQNISKQSG